MIAVDQIPEPRQRRRKGVVAPAATDAAAIYVRVSTDEQADDGKSLASQQAACQQLAERRGWTVAEVFADPGVSGGQLDRPGLDALRAAVARGDVAHVVVYALDRLSRKQRDTHNLLAEFAEAGVGLVSASQDFDTSGPMGRAMVGMLAVFAELQRDEIRARTKRALAAKAARGEVISRLPFGLRRNGRGYEIDPDTWPIVERVLAESAAGSSTTAVAAGLNRDAIPTASGAGCWHPAAIAALRSNPKIRAAVGSAG